MLVKMTMMMMAPSGTPAPPEARGRGPPFFFFFLDLLLDGRRVSPLILGSHGLGGARAPPRLDLPLCSLLFRAPQIWPKPFLIFPEIRNSDCADLFTQFFSRYKLPCARSRAPTDIRGEHNPPPHAMGLGRALVYRGPCGPPFLVIPTPKNHKYSKIILCGVASCLDFVDMCCGKVTTDVLAKGLSRGAIATR